MNLQETIKADLIEAMKSKDAKKVSVLRMLQSAIKNKLIDLRKQEIADEIVIEVIIKQAKQRKEAIKEYNMGGRADLAAAEQEELKILEGYLPRQLSEEEIEKEVASVISAMSAQQGDFGKVMGIAAKNMKGSADGDRIKAVVERMLQK